MIQEPTPVNIGKEKLRLEEQLQKQIETQKKIRYDLARADSDMEHTTYLLNKLQSFPKDYFIEYRNELDKL